MRGALRLLFILALAVSRVCATFYDDLGVPESADEGTIKKAYRKLSLKYHPGACPCGRPRRGAPSPPHTRTPTPPRPPPARGHPPPPHAPPPRPSPAPDKNQGDAEAQKQFTRVARAYEVLSDSEKKQIYDYEGQEGLDNFEKGKGNGGGSMNPFDMFFGGGGGGGGGGRRKGPDAQVEIEVTLEDLYNGGERQARISRNVICPKCKGSGAKDGATSKCGACGGRGVRMVNQQMAPGFVVQMQETCGECGGKGQVYKTKCPNCNGRRVVPNEKTLVAHVEKGMPSDGEIKFERESEQTPGVTPGDVIFKFKQAPHAKFRRAGDDLHHEMHLSLREALLGFSRSVTHLDGRSVPVKHDGVTQPFEVRKVGARAGAARPAAPPAPAPAPPSTPLAAANSRSRPLPPFAVGQRGHAAAQLPLAARLAARQVHRGPARKAHAGAEGGAGQAAREAVSGGGGRAGVVALSRIGRCLTFFCLLSRRIGWCVGGAGGGEGEGGGGPRPLLHCKTHCC